MFPPPCCSLGCCPFSCRCIAFVTTCLQSPRACSPQCRSHHLFSSFIATLFLALAWDLLPSRSKERPRSLLHPLKTLFPFLQTPQRPRRASHRCCCAKTTAALLPLSLPGRPSPQLPRSNPVASTRSAASSATYGTPPGTRAAPASGQMPPRQQRRRQQTLPCSHRHRRWQHKVPPYPARRPPARQQTDGGRIWRLHRRRSTRGDARSASLSFLQSPRLREGM